MMYEKHYKNRMEYSKKKISKRLNSNKRAFPFTLNIDFVIPNLRTFHYFEVQTDFPYNRIP